MTKPKDISGMKFSHLLVIRLLEERGNNYKARWECLCDCGNITIVCTSDLTSGNTKSCGCARKIDPNRSHKVCGTCGVDKPIDEFHLCSLYTDTHTNICKLCASNRKKKNLPKSRKYEKDKRHSDISYRTTKNLRVRIYKALKGNSKSFSTVELLGCEIDYLKHHLEHRFDENMSWGNYGSYWHIDHIKPCAAFDLTREEEQRKCFHYTNLQPLEAKANIVKGDKYSE